eukprot:TRINITY_DN2334_c2_g1_i1.p1 TRINITY_DN2334_c2_g1~~TRINITY_DN2334_c2_g1_i1.p1  ORF type:complete len:320 (+),score=80.79 TRINITY_DN2334_c2_g1_i1:70-960(+)
MSEASPQASPQYRPYSVSQKVSHNGSEWDRLVVESKDISPPVKFEVVYNLEMGGLLDVVVTEPLNIGKWLDTSGLRKNRNELESVLGYVVRRYREHMYAMADKKCGAVLAEVLAGYEFRVSHNMQTGSVEVVIKLEEGPQVSFIKVSRFSHSYCQAELKGPDGLYNLYGGRELRGAAVDASPLSWVRVVQETDAYLAKRKEILARPPVTQSTFFSACVAAFGEPCGNDHNTLTFMDGTLFFVVAAPPAYPASPPPPTISFPSLQKVFQPPKDNQSDVAACIAYFRDKIALHKDCLA